MTFPLKHDHVGYYLLIEYAKGKAIYITRKGLRIHAQHWTITL